MHHILETNQYFLSTSSIQFTFCIWSFWNHNWDTSVLDCPLISSLNKNRQLHQAEALDFSLMFVKRSHAVCNSHNIFTYLHGVNTVSAFSSQCGHGHFFPPPLCVWVDEHTWTSKYSLPLFFLFSFTMCPRADDLSIQQCLMLNCAYNI